MRRCPLRVSSSWRYSPLGVGDGLDLLRHRSILGFLGFSHLWTWGFWGLASLLSTESVWEGPAAVFFYLGGLGVPLGAAVMTWAGAGSSGLRGLGWRMVDPARISARWWVFILAFFPLLNLAAAGIVWVSGVDTSPPLALAQSGNLLAHPWNLLVFAGLVLFIGPLPEEVGWRGYLLDRLERRWSAGVATLFVGLAWWSWHLPLFLLPGYFDPFGGPPMGPAGYLWDILVGAVLYTWIYNSTRRSVLAVTVFHFAGNLSGELLGVSEKARFWHLILKTGVALAVLTEWRNEGRHQSRWNSR